MTRTLPTLVHGTDEARACPFWSIQGDTKLSGSFDEHIIAVLATTAPKDWPPELHMVGHNEEWTPILNVTVPTAKWMQSELDSGWTLLQWPEQDVRAAIARLTAD